MIAILTGMREYLIGFGLHFLMISDAEHLFMCLCVIYMSSLEKYLFMSSVHLLIELFVFLMLS